MSQVNKDDSVNYLIQAVISNDPQTVNDLLNEGLDPNRCLDEAHITALHYAAQNNSLEVIPLLVEAGADLEAHTEPEGLTPLDVAILHNHNRVAQALIAYLNNADQYEH